MPKKKRTKDRRRYSDSFKREVARRYLSGEFSYRVGAEEYGLPSGHSVREFVRWYRRQSEYLSINVEVMSDSPPGEETPKETGCELSREELLERLRQLELERDAAKLAAEGWKTLVQIAEEELCIEIVKKSVAKQSEK